MTHTIEDYDGNGADESNGGPRGILWNVEEGPQGVVPDENTAKGLTVAPRA